MSNPEIKSGKVKKSRKWAPWIAVILTMLFIALCYVGVIFIFWGLGNQPWR